MSRQWDAQDRGFASLTFILAVSGFCGLGYEIVWTRLLANVLGHEMVAVLGVLTGLFGGLALGSGAFGPHIARSGRPALWYAALEVTIGVWALVLAAIFPAVGEAALFLAPADASSTQQWLVAFAIPFFVLLPATCAMGATLPAFEPILAPLAQRGQAVGWAYGANTFGAVCGTVVTTFWILPALSLSRTLLVLGTINVICAAAIIARRGGASGRLENAPRPRTGGAALSFGALFVSGLLGIGYEVVAVRTLSQLLENTVYSFAALLAVYLLGTALGAVLYARLMARQDCEKSTTSMLCLAASLACGLGVVVLGHADTIGGTPHSLSAAIIDEFLIATAVFLAPAMAMGALFSHLAQGYRIERGTFGAALAANTAGAALAPIVFGPVLFPLLGAKLCLVLIAAAYAAIAPEWNPRNMAVRTATAAAALSLLLAPLSLRFVQIPPGGQVLWHRDGIMASVSVVEDRAHDRYLEINNHFRLGGTASIRSDYREADIPLLLHPAPKHALFLGLGTGTTISATGAYPALTVDGVELVPEVPETFDLFQKSAPNIGSDSAMRIHIADARRYVRTVKDHYDVVIADVYHPWIDGAGALYTREHFAAIRERLAERGIFCQWLPLHQLDLATLRTITRTFLAEFPHASAYLAQFSVGAPLVALIGSGERLRFQEGWFAQRVTDHHLRERLASVGLDSDLALFGLALADANALAAFAGDGPLNTDDRQIVTFEAPAIAYSTPSHTGDRLLALTGAFHLQARSLYEGSAIAATRLEDYWRARDRFLALGVRSERFAQPGDVIAQVAPQLIGIVRLSPDFDAAYRPVLAMASDLARRDLPRARRLLEDLETASPARPEAQNLLAQLQAR